LTIGGVPGDKRGGHGEQATMLEALCPIVWEQVLNEKLSAAPVLTARR
jgi:hypothetical protein